jgi:hypothetical protein
VRLADDHSGRLVAVAQFRLGARALREGLSQFGCLELENLGVPGARLNLVHGGALAVEVAAPRLSCADRTVNT